MEWPFADPPNTAVFTTIGVVDRQEWIYLVTHDAEDGAWQFHHARDSQPRVAEALVVALHRILKIEPAVAELADLPLGWQAWRESKDAEWIRAPHSE
ncbi:MAG TPA: hypothetical protein VL175_13775 [Pirellulales bacterium]|jgi:hypothetical protein|nr:hypothetical protein [Pirellulales bacterium]